MNDDFKVLKREEAKKLLIDRYGSICFANGIVSKKNPLTQHHLNPVRLGGKTIFCNLALLTVVYHELFNEIEKESNKKAKYINDAFRDYKHYLDDNIRKQVHNYMEAERISMGYEIKDTGKILTLRRK